MLLERFQEDTVPDTAEKRLAMCQEDTLPGKMPVECSRWQGADSPQYSTNKVQRSKIIGLVQKSALERIHREGRKTHVPLLYRSSRRKNICYMIVTLLGDNLRRIKVYGWGTVEYGTARC